MHYLKTFGLASLIIAALMAPMASPASATTLEIGGWAQNQSVTVEAGVSTGGATNFRDTNYNSYSTCTASTITFSTFIYTGVVEGGIGTLSFWPCSGEVTVLKRGLLKVSSNFGTTNGTISSSGMELRIRHQNLGYEVNCKPNAGAPIGTLNGVKEWNATLNIKAVLQCGFLVPDLVWEGTYTVWNPQGLGVVS